MITLIIIAIIIVKYVGLAHFSHNKQAGKLLHVFHSGQSARVLVMFPDGVSCMKIMQYFDGRKHRNGDILGASLITEIKK